MPPFIYYGGKVRLAPRIAAMLPEHTQYVEPFAGSLAVLLAKSPVRLETVNDLDGDLMLFWRVLRDRARPPAGPHSAGGGRRRTPLPQPLSQNDASATGNVTKRPERKDRGGNAAASVSIE